MASCKNLYLHNQNCPFARQSEGNNQLLHWGNKISVIAKQNFIDTMIKNNFSFTL